MRMQGGSGAAWRWRWPSSRTQPSSCAPTRMQRQLTITVYKTKQSGPTFRSHLPQERLLWVVLFHAD